MVTLRLTFTELPLSDDGLLCKYMSVSSACFTENGQLAIGWGEPLESFWHIVESDSWSVDAQFESISQVIYE